MVIDMIFKFLSIFIFLVLFFTNSHSKSISGDELKILVENWLTQHNVEANINILGKVKYPKCSQENLMISDISGTNKLIKVSCLAPNEWSLILRNKINIERKIKPNNDQLTNVYALNKPKRSGSIINKEDIIMIKKKISNINGLIIEESDLVGRKLKKSVSANRALYHNSLKKDWLIEKDSHVLIENNLPFITIRAEGIALENADFGDKLKVKNLKSGKIVFGFAENRKKILLNAKQN